MLEGKDSTTEGNIKDCQEMISKNSSNSNKKSGGSNSKSTIKAETKVSSPQGSSIPQEVHEELKKIKKEYKLERESITIFKSPVTTLYLCLLELFIQLKRLSSYLRSHYIVTIFLTLLIGAFISLHFIEGSHSKYLKQYVGEAYIALEWIVLGVLSSVGLGTGLHTFMLYLGPFIAKITLAATECNSVDFPIYGEDAFLCPTTSISDTGVTFWQILRKVQFASLCWGFGTAIGELPPYFIARAAKLSGKKLEEEEEEEEDSEKPSWHHHLMEKAKSYIDVMLHHYAFITILLMASIPNPLFDLAGLTCGYSLISFWTFFGATIIGKAFIKAHIQTITVITLFSKQQLSLVIGLIEKFLPFFKGRIQDFFDKERAKFHPENIGKHDGSSDNKSIVGKLWDCLLIFMLIVFAISIINSTAQSRKFEQQRISIEKLKVQKMEEFNTEIHHEPIEEKKSKKTQ